MTVAWILNTIEPSLRSTISYVQEANELLDEIKQQFAVMNASRVQQLKKALANRKKR